MTLIARHGPAWTRIDYHQFFLMEPEHQDFVPEEAGQLISPTGEAVIVHTGIAGGSVAVHIEIHDHEPRLDDTDWEEVAEASMQVEEGVLMVRCLMEDPPDLPVLTPAGPGLYRVRAHARGRDIAYDGWESRSQESISSRSGRLPTCRCTCSNRPTCVDKACAAPYAPPRSSYSSSARAGFNRRATRPPTPGETTEPAAHQPEHGTLEDNRLPVSGAAEGSQVRLLRRL